MRVEIDDDARQYLGRHIEFPSELIGTVGHISFILHIAGDREINVARMIDLRERMSGNGLRTLDRRMV